MNGKQLFVIAFDGFCWDYCDRHDLSNFKRFYEGGARTPFVKPVFPTLTFPNFYSVATGKFPENHGLVANEFDDPVTGGRFRLDDQTSQQDVRWYTMNDCEPFWVTAKKNGRTVGAYHWLVGDIEFKDGKGDSIVLERLERWTEETNRYRIPSFKSRLDICLNWIVQDRLDLTMLYIDEPDFSAHEYGPNDEKVVGLLKEIDASLGYLLDKVDELGIKDSLDIIILSDHGSTACPPENRFQLLDLIESIHVDGLELMETGPVFTMRARNGVDLHDGVISQLRRAEQQYHFRALLKDEIPERFRWKNNRRIPDVLILCDENYCACGGELDVNRYVVGQHGYDNELASMRAILYARGPSFKTGYITETETEMIDTYRLICSLLRIVPRNNDSTNDKVLSLLK